MPEKFYIQYNEDNATLSKAELAYIQIYYANGIKERQNLLKYILKDPEYCFMFLTERNPNAEEFMQAFEKIKDDVQLCFKLIAKLGFNLDRTIRTACIETIKRSPVYSLRAAGICILTIDEKRLLYKTHRAKYIQDDSLDNYWELWNAFGELFLPEDNQHLINKLYEIETKESITIAETLLLYGKNFTDDQRDILENKTLTYVLRS